MTYKVRLWVEDDVVKCCSGVCTEISCPRVGICKETEIEELATSSSQLLEKFGDAIENHQRYGAKWEGCG